MEDDEFNFHRIVKSEKNVAQQALKELFELRWNRTFPETPWANNTESVKLFEQKEDEQFQNRLKGLSNKKKGRKNDKRNRLQSTFRDDTNWNTYNWDTGKYVYALVDSKLFSLDQTDETGMPVSEHMVKMKDIRNSIAHFTTPACETDYFDQTLKSLEDHMKALKLLQLDVTPYLEELQKIKSEEKPVSSQSHFEMRTQFEKLKISQEVYEEKKKKYKVLKQLNAEREKVDRLQYKHSEEVKRLQHEHSEELKKLKSEIEQQKKRHSENLKKLESEIEQQKKRHSEELKKCDSEIEQQKKRHSEELKKCDSEIEQQKKRHSEELARLRVEIDLLKLKELMNPFQKQILCRKLNTPRFRHAIIIPNP